MDELMIGNVVLVPLIIGILEVIKKLGLVPKYIPVVSVVLGVISGFALNGFTNPVESAYTGIAVGLAAVGLYSGTKNATKK